MMELRRVIIFRDFCVSNQLSRIRTAHSFVTILSFLGVFDVHHGRTEAEGELQKTKRCKRRNDADTGTRQKKCTNMKKQTHETAQKLQERNVSNPRPKGLGGAYIYG